MENERKKKPLCVEGGRKIWVKKDDWGARTQWAVTGELYLNCMLENLYNETCAFQRCCMSAKALDTGRTDTEFRDNPRFCGIWY